MIPSPDNLSKIESYPWWMQLVIAVSVFIAIIAYLYKLHKAALSEIVSVVSVSTDEKIRSNRDFFKDEIGKLRDDMRNDNSRFRDDLKESISRVHLRVDNLKDRVLTLEAQTAERLRRDDKIDKDISELRLDIRNSFEKLNDKIDKLRT